MAHGVPAARHCVPPHPDRHAVRHGAAAAGVTFLHPLALVGLAAAAIPALLHLLERRVPPEAEFPPLRYLSEAERQNARRLKLRHLLLLLLRTALRAREQERRCWRPWIASASRPGGWTSRPPWGRLRAWWTRSRSRRARCTS